MPKDTIQSLKKENDNLKAQIAALTKNLKSLEQNLDRQERATGGHNGGESSSQEHAKTVIS